MWAFAVVMVLVGLWYPVLSRMQHCQKLEVDGFRLGGGIVHLVYTMERKCLLCYKEVNKLWTLKSRMAKFGQQIEVAVGMNRPSATNQRRKLPPELRVDETQVWKKLGKKNGHIFIFDKCGKLAYQVITPWSKQVYPFTGMAALSAILDEPCGECNITMQANDDPRTENSIDPVSHEHSEKTSDEANDYGSMRLKDSKLLLTTVYRSRHSHVESGRKMSYNVVELRSNDPKYHGHDGSSFVDTADIPQPEKYSGSTTAITSEPEVTKRPETETMTVPPSDYYDDYSDDVGSSSSETPGEADPRELIKHYQPLMKWMNCAQQIMGTQRISDFQQ